jgi:hypothetical protein
MIRVLISTLVAGVAAGLTSLFLVAPTAAAVGLGAGALTAEIVRSLQSGQPMRWRNAIGQSVAAAAVAFLLVAWLARSA